jgi:hyperosmotically inducible protein
MTVLFLSGSLLMPVAGYTDDMDSDRSSVKTYVKDSMITGKVKAALAKEKDVSALHIKVDTDDKGVVQLSGTAKTQTEADRAVEIATSVEGVTSVSNEITVDPNR